MASKVRMRAISQTDSEGRSVLAPTGSGPAIKGDGDFNFACAGCDLVLFRNVGYAQIRNLVVKCGACGVLNEAPLV